MSVKLRRKALKDGRTSLYLDIYHNGKRRYEFLELYLNKDSKANKETLALAERLRADRQIDIDRAVHGQSKRQVQQQSFLDFFKKVADEKNVGNRTSWMHTYKNIRDFDANVTFAQIDRDWLKQFRAFIASVVAPGTVILRFSHVRTALRRAIVEEIIDSDPSAGIKLGKIERHPVYLVQEELERLAATPCPSPLVGRAFLFSIYTGLRLSDVRKLRWREVHGTYISLTMQKSRHDVTVPIAPVAKALLGEPGDADALVFDGLAAMANSNISAIIKRWAAAAEISKPITFHKSRHTFATLLLTNGADIYTVSKLLGHTDIRTTQVYAHVIDEKRAHAISTLPMLPTILQASGQATIAQTEPPGQLHT